MAAGRVNLHLFASPILNESRLIKEAADSLEHGRFDRVVVLGFWEGGLARRETHPLGLEIERCAPLLRRLQARGTRLPGPVRSGLKAGFFAEYSLAAIRLARRLRPSHVSIHNPLWLPLGRLVARLTGARLVYLPHELEAGRAGIAAPLRKLFAWAERSSMPACDAVVTVCEPIAHWYRDAYRRSDIRVVRNVPRRSDVALRPVAQSFRQGLPIPEDALLLVYQGLIDRARGCADLAAAMQGSPHHLVFMGYGDYAQEIAAGGQANVHYWPAVPLDTIVSQTAGADVGVFVVQGALELSYALSLPNKFFEYLHAGLPVIVSENLTYLSQIVREHRLGWVIAPDGLAALVATLDRADVLAFKDNVRDYARACLWDLDARIFDEVYAA